MGIVNLIGTNHDDFLGPLRLSKLFQHRKPSIISIEQAPSSYLSGTLVSLCSQRLFDSLIPGFGMNKRSMAKFLEMDGISCEGINWRAAHRWLKTRNFESLVSHIYSSKHKIFVSPIEDPELRRKALLGLNGDSYGFLKFGVEEVIANQGRIYSDVREGVPNEDGKTFLRERDNFMAPLIVKLSEIYGRVVHVGGACHMYGEGSLYDLLSDRGLQVERCTLDSADLLDNKGGCGRYSIPFWKWKKDVRKHILDTSKIETD